MPISKPQDDHFPPGLLEEPGDEGTTWYALYTRSRCEKLLMKALNKWQIPFCCPLIPKKYQSPSGRWRTSYLPLFTNYVFLRADEQQRYRALTTGYIINAIDVADGSRLQSDLANVVHMLASEQPVTPEKRLQPGALVRVRTGALQGIEGIVIERQGEKRLLVAVDFLQQGASLSLRDFEVEPIL